jgi:hypothetical protein
MGEGLERFDMRLIRIRLRERQARHRLHISKYIEVSKACQRAVYARAGASPWGRQPLLKYPIEVRPASKVEQSQS